VLGVDCRLKAATHRCRRGQCQCTLQGCSGVDKDVSASCQTKVVNSRECTVGQKVPMAHVASLSGRHPDIRCLDVVMCCDNGLSHPNDVDPYCRAVECAYCLDWSPQGTSQVFNFSSREAFGLLCRPFLQGRLVASLPFQVFPPR